MSFQTERKKVGVLCHQSLALADGALSSKFKCRKITKSRAAWAAPAAPLPTALITTTHLQKEQKNITLHVAETVLLLMYNIEMSVPTHTYQLGGREFS